MKETFGSRLNKIKGFIVVWAEAKHQSRHFSHIIRTWKVLLQSAFICIVGTQSESETSGVRREEHRKY